MVKDFEIYMDNWFVEGSAELRYIDESFDHEFGVERRGSWVVDSFDVSSVGIIDEDGEDHEDDWATMDADIRNKLTNLILELDND